MLMAAKKDRRIEMRADANAERLIARAAAALGESVSSFVLRAAQEEARRVLASPDVTLMPAEQFDELIAALDEPDEIPALRQATARPRRYVDET
ncbi:MAG: hypothetical protein JWR24_1549 [Actinoallomurus sp.]|nr:hypothetical protein [Actinoallomurus sp.]